jgi:hypothetical protein
MSYFQTVYINGATGAVLDGVVGTTGATAAPPNAVQVGGQYLPSPPTFTTGAFQALLIDSDGNLLVNVSAQSLGTVEVAGTVTANAGTGTFSENLAQVAGSAVATTGVAGELLIGVAGHTGAAVDAPLGGTATNAIIVQGATAGIAIPISGSVSVSNFPSTQNVAVISPVDGSGYVEVDLKTAIPTGSNTIGAVAQASGPWTVKPDGTAWTLTGTSANVDVTNTVPVSQSGSWTVAATESGTWSVDILGHTGAALDAPIGGTAPNALIIQGATGGISVPVSGTVTVTPSGTQNENLTQIAGSSVTTTGVAGEQKVGIVGATGATLDSPAGTSNTQAITIQGNTGGVAVPVSGTVTSNQGGAPWTVKPDGTVWTLTGTSANVDVTNTVSNNITQVGGSTVATTGVAGELKVGNVGATGAVFDAPIGGTAPNAVIIQGATGGIPVPVSGTVNASISATTVTGSDAIANTALTSLASTEEPLVTAHFGYNGSTWDRLRTAGIGNNVASTGLGARTVYGQFNTPYATGEIVPTAGDFGSLQTDANARLQVSLERAQAPYIVQKADGVSTGSVTTISATFASNNTAANTIVVALATGSNALPSSVTDTLGNTYTLMIVQAAVGWPGISLWFATNIKSGANTVTAAITSSSAFLAVYELNGIIAAPNQGSQLAGLTATNCSAAQATSTNPAFSPSFSGIPIYGPNVYAITLVGVGGANVTFTPGINVELGVTTWNTDFSGNTNGTQNGLFSFACFSAPFFGGVGGDLSFSTNISSSEKWSAVTGYFYPLPVSISGKVSLLSESALNSNSPVYAVTVQGSASSLPVTVAGSLTNNSAAPAAGSNLGVLPAIAESALPSYSSGDQVLLVTDTHGNLNTDYQYIAGAAVSTAASGVQKVGIVGNAGSTVDNTINGAAPTNAIAVEHAPSTAAAFAVTPKYINSTAQAVIKSSAGNLYGCVLLNQFNSSTTTTTTTPTSPQAGTISYIHFFNTTTTTSLATSSWLFALPIPASPSVMAASAGGQSTASFAGSGAPLSIPPGAIALANFSSGIVIVINTTSTSATTASGTAPTGTIWFE